MPWNLPGTNPKAAPKPEIGWDSSCCWETIIYWTCWYLLCTNGFKTFLLSALRRLLVVHRAELCKGRICQLSLDCGEGKTGEARHNQTRNKLQTSWKTSATPNKSKQSVQWNDIENPRYHGLTERECTQLELGLPLESHDMTWLHQGHPPRPANAFTVWVWLRSHRRERLHSPPLQHVCGKRPGLGEVHQFTDSVM